MGLRLVESCQQVNVYGPVWTEGMWAEINHAERLGIPVLTDQKELGKPPRRRTKQGKSDDVMVDNIPPEELEIELSAGRSSS